MIDINLWNTQIIVGTILGGSSLTRPTKAVNYQLSMRNNNVDWLKYKIYELQEFFTINKLTKDGQTYRCKSKCNKFFTDMYNLIYERSKRKVTMDLLSPLRDIGIAVWFLDSGGKTGRNKKNAYLNLTKFSKKEIGIIHEYFYDIVEMPCRIIKNGKGIRLVFTVDGTLKLLRIISPKFPYFMHHRI